MAEIDGVEFVVSVKRDGLVYEYEVTEGGPGMADQQIAEALFSIALDIQARQKAPTGNGGAA